MKIKSLWYILAASSCVAFTSNSYMLYLLFKSFSAPHIRTYALQHLIYPQIPGFLLLICISFGAMMKKYFSLVLILIASYFTFSNLITYFLTLNDNELRSPGAGFSIHIAFNVLNFLNTSFVFSCLIFTLVGYYLIYYHFRFKVKF